MSVVPIKREKKQLLNKLDELDEKAELGPLDENEPNLKLVLNERLSHLLREEELKWYQRANVKHYWKEMLILNTFI